MQEFDSKLQMDSAWVINLSKIARLISDSTVPSLYLNVERPRINTSGAKIHNTKERTTNVKGDAYQPASNGDGRDDQISLPDCYSVARKTSYDLVRRTSSADLHAEHDEGG
jgi:hypothetical protein